MALETVQDIDDLVITNPTASDPKSAGDDHIRNIKIALKNGFPGFTGSVIVTGTDGGSANTYTLSPSTALPAYVAGTLVCMKVTNANTGASTLNISGLGAGAIQTVSGAALTSGDLPAGRYALMVVTAATPVFQLLNVTKNYVDQLAFLAALPAQALGLLISDATNASFSKTFTGFAVNTVRATVASHATTADIWAAAGNEIDFTGTATVTDFPDAPVAGASRILHCASTPTFTNNANISVQGAANYTAAAGDIVTVHAITTTTFRVTIERADGLPVNAVDDHEVVVHTGNGHGSTNNKIRRFTTTLTSTGTAITYADSAANGASFTINETGLYSVYYADAHSAGGEPHGISVNSSQLTTAINVINAADRLGSVYVTTANPIPMSRVVKLTAGDVVRPHTGGVQDGASSLILFAIRKVNNV